ncbi:MAG: hypothetical protein JWM85_2100 [Acidimicrobiaceae bacterium]|nr:hypothetical protein [Acidimicrobiaceae bacterium]
MLDVSRLPGGLEAVDAVFHLAGEPITPRRWGMKKRELIRASRTVTTDVISRALAACDLPPRVLVSGSAVGFYGDRGDSVLDEESGVGAGFLAEVCRAWEEATAPARQAGVRVVTVRTGMVLGAGGGLLSTLVPLFRLGLGARLASGRQWTSWIALSDHAAAMIHAATTESLSGPCNLVAPEPVRNSEFTAALATALHRRAVLSAPRPALEVALGRRTTAELVCASQRVVPRALKASGFRFGLGLHEAIAAAIGGTAGSHDTVSKAPS